MQLESRPNHVLRDSAILIATATGLAYIVGYIEEAVYFQRLGIDVVDLNFPSRHFMMRSLTSMWVPIILFGAFLAYLHWRQAKAMAEGKPLKATTPSSLAALIAILWAGTRLAALGDNTPNLLGNRGTLTLLDVAIHASTLVYMWLLGKKWLPEGTSHERQSQPLLVVIAVALLMLSAFFSGNDRGNDAAWACHELPVATFNPPSSTLGPNATYWVVAHQDGNYYLRDVEAGAAARDYVIVRPADGQSVEITWAAARHNCRT